MLPRRCTIRPSEKPALQLGRGSFDDRANAPRGQLATVLFAIRQIGFCVDVKPTLADELDRGEHLSGLLEAIKTDELMRPLKCDLQKEKASLGKMFGRLPRLPGFDN